MKKLVLLSATVVPLLLGACSSTEQGAGNVNRNRAATGGAVGGAILGGIIGHQSGRGLEGAAIGGAVGGVGGSAVGAAKDDEQQRARNSQGGF
jgi:uncharacterized protein YcfJ